ncbi:MAG: right-handed parallel beta-helix repeat-containing protein [Verrucomicrobia bacterium]|nr:right-handed parallel beta-helix repeat-containing protein [Verrucomicrobiota bacterium]
MFALPQALLISLLSFTVRADDSNSRDFSPPPEERQLQAKMRSKMKILPTITVGHAGADIVGTDNRGLQAAVDYIAGLDGGIVEILPGTYVMNDSLHLRANVTVRGTAGETILLKSKCSVSALGLDGDFGEEQVTVAAAAGFQPGYGITVWDAGSGGFHTTVGRIIGTDGNTLAIDTSLNADCMVSNDAKAATVFPVVSGTNIEGARIEGLTIDGNKDHNVHLNGCRGAGIYLYRGFGTVIRDCVVRNFNGDGISFQQSNDVIVENCVSENNASLGLHPGSGSQRATIRGCRATGNGEDGLFLCWRVRHGVFESNFLENNGRFGISIGHKDSDNLFAKNLVRYNHSDGIFFRNESLGMAGHRNRVEDNLIEDNGRDTPVAGIRIRGEVKYLVFKNNTLRDTRTGAARLQTSGILIEENVGDLDLDGNHIEAEQALVDQRE